MAHPIAPRIVANAPCQEIVISGKALDKKGNALDGIPVPISTPGWDVSPYTTLSQYITKDPDTGLQNMGIYRGQVKAPRRLGMNPSLELRPGIYGHWEKARARGTKLEAAVVLGAPPCVAFTAAQKLPESMEELHVAGGLAGAPINVVKAKTVDLLVPAEAEIVIEGLIETEWLEPEAPFGESHGHVNLQEYNAYHGGDLHHQAARCDPHLDHLAGDAERIERDEARGAGADVPGASARHAGHSRASSASPCTSR